MQIRFGLYTSDVRRAVQNGLAKYAQDSQSPALPAALAADQFNALQTRLGNIETAVQGISQILNRHFGML